MSLLVLRRKLGNANVDVDVCELYDNLLWVTFCRVACPLLVQQRKEVRGQV